MAKNMYICGLPRGGTTLTSLALGSHPDAHPMGETMYLAKLDPHTRSCSCGEVGCHQAMRLHEHISRLPNAHATYEAYGALDVLREPDKIPNADTIRWQPPTTAKDLEQLIARGAQGIGEIATVFADIYGPHAFVDNTKEIAFAEHLDPNKWTVAVVTRDLRGVAHSVLKAALRKGAPRSLEAKLPIWRDFASRAARLVENGATLVRYEDLCAGSLVALNEVGRNARLGSAYAWDMLRTPYEHHMLMGNRASHQWNDGGIGGIDEAWRHALPADDAAQVVAAVPQFYASFGYQP